MTKNVKLDNRGIKIIVDGIWKPIKKGKPFFDNLGTRFDQWTQITFRVLGGRSGHNKWIGFRPATLKTPAGTWNIRYGTDLKGRPKGTYTPGKKRSGIRRYSGSSKLLQAGGQFRQSFNIIRTTDKKVIYGSRMKIAKQIMSDPNRPVLFVTNKDNKQIKRMYIDFYNRRQKF